MGATVGSYYLTRRPSRPSFAIDPTRGRGAGQHGLPDWGQQGASAGKSHDLFVRRRPGLPSSLPDLRASVTLLRHRVHRGDRNAERRLRLHGSDVLVASVYRNPTTAQLTSPAGDRQCPSTCRRPLPPIGNLLDQRLGNFGIRKHQRSGLRHQLSAGDELRVGVRRPGGQLHPQVRYPAVPGSPGLQQPGARRAAMDDQGHAGRSTAGAWSRS